MSSKDIKFLVVDDDKMCRRILEVLLQQLGYMVDLAENASAAIEFLSKNTYKLMFLDIGLPSNFFMTASHGGKHDYLIDAGYFDRVAYVVNTEEEAEEKGLPIDHDDSHCFLPSSFCLLVHNTQPKGSQAAKALANRKKQNKFIGYSKASKALVK